MNKNNFTKKNKNKNRNGNKKKLTKKNKFQKRKNKKIHGGTLFLNDVSDETFKSIVSIGFEFETSLAYLIYDKNRDKYYLGDTYFLDNGRRKDEKIFQNNIFTSSSSSIGKEEFYSQEDENSVITYLNDYFQEQLQKYLETSDSDEYYDNKDFIERDAMKIIKNGKMLNMMTEVNDEPSPMFIGSDELFNYLNYKCVEYVITFYSININTNPIIHYLKIALNILKSYFDYIEKINENNNPDIILLIEGNREEYNTERNCKLYKIPQNINEYVLSDKERHDIDIGYETIYDENTPNKIVSNVEYNYLVEENARLSKINISPQVTIGIVPLELINVAKKIVNSPTNESFDIGFIFINNEIISKGIELDEFDKNILCYVFYCSYVIYDEMLNNPKMKYIFKYTVSFLIRHKMSDFKIFKNINFVNFIIESYRKIVSEVSDVSEIICFYYLILLISKDAYYSEIDNIGIKMDDSLLPYLNKIEENSLLLSNFLREETTTNLNREFMTKLKKMYSTWNELLIKQYPYDSESNPLLFEIRFFSKDINKIKNEYGIITDDSIKALNIEDMLKICSSVENTLNDNLSRTTRMSMKRPADFVEQIQPKKKKTLKINR